MSNKAKKIFLALSIVVPFLLYCVFYYSKMISNAPYKYSEFTSITLKAGLGKNYEKTFNSKTQDFQYIDVNDSLVKTKVRLNKDDLLFLHRKAAELGFWDWPEQMIGDETGKAPRYYLEFEYQRKKKFMEIDAEYNENTKLRDAALQLVKTVDQAILDAQDRENKAK
ncbi:hypothetical protein GJJ64_03730 [Pedobacter sp. HX-22-1]|jgi:hypothetical protein|uniref:Uncharacterized protein n=2 Tax=Pedobacter puniceum TaxID=2666136 RepID=A0A7K0FKI2_9SPHI|nr:hypothetical protein [Pedobacter puniceum]